MKSLSIDYWRNYFRTANSDIFDIIDNAIIVAASDCPKEFRLRRDRIAERLFFCRLTRCSGCNLVELAVPAHEGDYDGRGCKSRDDENGDDDGDDIEIDIGDGYEFDIGAGFSKESKVNSCNRDNDVDNGEVNLNDHLEALTDAIEEESQVAGEVYRIKDILINSQDQSDSLLFDSLRRLQLMDLTVDTLKATEIGKAVNGLRKHGSKQIRSLARTLIDDWKDLVDEWCSATRAIKGDDGTPDSINPSSIVDEEGLPSPPLDEGAFFATHTTSIELSKFFDGMDDDGNPRHGEEFIKNSENRRPSLEKKNITKQKQQNPVEANGSAKDKSQQVKRQDAVMRPSKLSNTDSGPGRPPLQHVGHKADNQLKLQQKTDKITSQRKLPSGQQDKSKCSDEAAVQKKLEATKRKLQESYQQAENAKRQRTIQVMELHDLPKQGLRKNPQMRQGNHVRHWAHGRC